MNSVAVERERQKHLHFVVHICSVCSLCACVCVCMHVCAWRARVFILWYASTFDDFVHGCFFVLRLSSFICDLHF